MSFEAPGSNAASSIPSGTEESATIAVVTLDRAGRDEEEENPSRNCPTMHAPVPGYKNQVYEQVPIVGTENIQAAPRSNSSAIQVDGSAVISVNNHEEANSVTPEKPRSWRSLTQTVIRRVWMAFILLYSIVVAFGLLAGLFHYAVMGIRNDDDENASLPTPTPTQTMIRNDENASLPTPTQTCIRNNSLTAFESIEQLYEAIDLYMDEATRYRTAEYGPTLNDWDVSRIQIFDQLFVKNRWNQTYFSPAGFDFTEDLSCWNTSKATSMIRMFYNAKDFNGDIAAWDVSRVESMAEMLFLAKQFNRDLSRWDVGRVSNFTQMFNLASDFNQRISSWNVSGATRMNWTFFYAESFNQDLSSWDVRKVESAMSMFAGANAFNQSLCSWRTRLPPSANVSSMFGYGDLFGKGAANCPAKLLKVVLPDGPMCYKCV